MSAERNEPRITDDTDDTDEVIAGLIYTVEYLDCFRRFAFEEDPCWDIAISYLETAADVAQDSLVAARERGHISP